MSRINKIFLDVIIFFAVIIVVGITTVGTYIYVQYKDLPNIEELVSTYKPSIPTIIYDRNNLVVDSLYKEQRDLAKQEEIPAIVKQAFVAIEDKNFYNHRGIDIKRNFSSVVINIMKVRFAQGASTITQQLSRNAFLTKDKKISRKVKEILITFQIERMFTKEEIITKFLNEIYFGGPYGIKSAAKEFFRKDLKDLNIAEAAMLAGIPNRPEKYNPRKKLDNALGRAHLIIEQMYKENYITKEQYNEAMNRQFVLADPNNKEQIIDPLTTSVVYGKQGRTDSNVPDFTDIVYDILRSKVDENGERIFSDEDIYKGGLKIYSTVDLNIQRAAKEVFAKNELLKNKKGLEVGMVTMEAETGEVIAVNGGVSFVTGNFNRATMAKRQMGSSSKPMLYLAALLNGSETNTVINDTQLKFGTWQPANYGDKYYGKVTLLEALDRSLNMVSIKLLQKVGIPTLKETVKNFGVELNIPDNLTASLGSYEATVLQEAQIYSLIANGGYSVKPIFIKKVEDSYGNILYTETVKKEKKFDSIDISLLNYMLQSSVRNGTSSLARVRNVDGNSIKQGGKTGTTNENRTVWFSGITPKYVTSIYMGYDNNIPIPGNVTGGTGPAILWGEMYQDLINKGLYTDGKFDFIDSNIAQGVLTEQMLDTKTGLITEGGREFLLRSGKIELETKEKYSNGILGLLSNAGDETVDISKIQKPEDVVTQEVSTTTQESIPKARVNRILGE